MLRWVRHSRHSSCGNDGLTSSTCDYWVSDRSIHCCHYIHSGMHLQQICNVHSWRRMCSFCQRKTAGKWKQFSEWMCCIMEILFMEFHRRVPYNSKRIFLLQTLFLFCFVIIHFGNNKFYDGWKRLKVFQCSMESGETIKQEDSFIVSNFWSAMLIFSFVIVLLRYCFRKLELTYIFLDSD